MEMMNTTLEEEAKRKARALHVQVVGWAEKESRQEDAKNLGTKIGASDILFAMYGEVMAEVGLKQQKLKIWVK